LKKALKQGEHFASDLLDWVRIPYKNGDPLYAELADLFNGYPESGIRAVYQDIMFMCEVPNGQMRGKLPPLYEIKKILDATRKNQKKVPKPPKDYAMVCPECGGAYDMEQYRCVDGYIIRDMGDGYTEAVPCRDKKDPSTGPRLVKEKLEAPSKELLKLLK